jgi:carboxyl-terminal processing protease
LVVLVNHGTSGPAELVAAAVQDDGRGQLVGEKTFGEGSLQKTFTLQDGGAIILSIAKYASPSGKQFEDDAVTPGTVVASAKEQMDEEAMDTDVDSTTTAPPAVVKKTPPPPDDQLNKALDILKAKTA